ncbi:SdiA-regulated domain-containing protein [Sinimarinibacterium flocculans]|uniref:SdiA-regulated domain-containing protein n=1 Tax=Sinimarinibacterium flocculans TaxID=985250 RepID=UPI0035162550
MRFNIRRLSKISAWLLAAIVPCVHAQDAFDFLNEDVTSQQAVYSNIVRISGLAAPAPLSVSGHASARLAVNGGALQTGPVVVDNGDTVRVRLVSGPTPGDRRVATVSLGALSDNWTVRTVQAPDAIPDAFDFVDQTVESQQAVWSNIVRLAGLNRPATLTLGGHPSAQVAVNGGALQSGPVAVLRGDLIRLRLVSAGGAGSRSVTVDIGGVTDTWTVTTGASLAAPRLGFTAPGHSLDLANYTLVAQHDLPVGSGANLLAAEASAVTYNPDSGTLFIVSDHGTSVVEVARDGSFIGTMTLPADASQPQGTTLYDPEGIAYVGGGQFVVAEERTRQVSRFAYAQDTTLDSGAIQSVKLGTTIGNVGLEGVSYDPLTGGYILVKEKTPLGIFQTTVDFDAGTASNGSAATENSVNLFDPALAGVADFGDVYALSNVLPDEAGDRADLLVLSQESGVLLKMDRSGAILSRLEVGLPAQHEGIAADENLTLYLANELGGGAGLPQLWVYEPTTGPDAVGIGSHLYLGFETAVTAGSGSFRVSNGAGDTRDIDVSDAQVRFDGNTVRIDLSDDLLPGTAYTISAPAGVVRSTGGNLPSPALNAGFTTRTDPLPPKLLGTTPADNAVGITTSQIVLSFDEPVRAGSGNIVISDGAADTRVIAVGDVSQISFNGKTVEITPTAALNSSTTYNVQMAPGVIVDIAGNPFAGLPDAEAFNFTTATIGGAPPTELNAGELLFMGINGDDIDAIAFVLLVDVTAGTQIGFTDKDYNSASPTWPTNEAAFTWTADVDYPAGTIVTIQTNSLITDRGVAVGSGGGISTSAETYYAFQGTITDAGAGQITVDRFLAAINAGGGIAGDIPQVIIDADAYIFFGTDNARYAGSLDRSDLTAFAALVRDAANWETTDAAGYPLVDNSLFATAPPPGDSTELDAGDLLFVAMNADATDAFAFVLLEPVVAGTQIHFTDKDYNSASPTWPTNEAAFTWTADVDYAAGIIVTIQPDDLLADRGTLAGSGGGISASAETYYAFQGTITDADAGQITVERFIAAINTSGGAAGEIPAEIIAAGAYVSFAADNAKYAGSLDRADLAAFAARVRDTGQWQTSDASGFALYGGSFFGGTVLAAGDLLFMAANADSPDAFAFVLLQAVVAGTQVGFTDKDYAAGQPPTFPNNEAALTWTADTAYPAGTIVTMQPDVPSVDKGTLYGEGGGIGGSGETYYAFQGTILNPAAGQVYVDRFVAAINVGGASAGEIPAALTAAGAFIGFAEDNARYAGSLDQSDFAAFVSRVKDAANWAVSDTTAFPLSGGSLFP